jgi:hypothetical protein
VTDPESAEGRARACGERARSAARRGADREKEITSSPRMARIGTSIVERGRPRLAGTAEGTWTPGAEADCASPHAPLERIDATAHLGRAD